VAGCRLLCGIRAKSNKSAAGAPLIAFCAVSAVNASSVNSYRDEKNDEMRKINKAYLAE